MPKTYWEHLYSVSGTERFWGLETDPDGNKDRIRITYIREGKKITRTIDLGEQWAKRHGKETP